MTSGCVANAARNSLRLRTSPATTNSGRASTSGPGQRNFLIVGQYDALDMGCLSRWGAPARDRVPWPCGLGKTIEVRGAC